MTINQVKEELFPVLNAIEGVKEVYINDYNSETMTFCIEIKNDVIYKGLRGISSALRKKLRDIGISTKKGNLLGWDRPRKYESDFYGTQIETNYFMVDFIYAHSTLYLEREFTNEWHIFDDNDFLQSNDKHLETLFRDTFHNFSCIEDHIDYLEKRYEFGGQYDIFPIYKFEHSGIRYEVAPSCRFDSGLVGIVAIEKDSKLSVSDFIIDINNVIENGYCV